VIANVRASDEERVRSYGVADTVDSNTVPLAEAVRRARPEGIDVLIDLASDAESFASVASLVQPGGAAVSTRYVADVRALLASGVRAVNFVLRQTSEVLARLADDLSSGRIVPPPVTGPALDEVPAALGSGSHRHAVKTVIVL
jgi:NADPH:quinone reductase-like Zn-dependent oxidoreductase